MKPLLNITLLFLLMLNSTILVFAQPTSNVEFTYDKSGNRTIRQIVDLKIPEDSSSDTVNTERISNITNYSEVIADHKVSIFPNPTAGMFKVEIGNHQINQNVSLYLHTLNGSLIYENKNAKSVTQIDIRNHDNGAYILTVLIAGKRKTWKIIKN